MTWRRRGLLSGSPVEPEDLDDHRGYLLVETTLPALGAAGAHTDEGLVGLGLPASYPLDAEGREIPHLVCHDAGAHVYDAGLSGVHCRSATGEGRELAWYPRRRQRARPRRVHRFGDWYYRSEGSAASPPGGA